MLSMRTRALNQMVNPANDGEGLPMQTTVPGRARLIGTKNTPMTNWKDKLLAFLHDQPHKPRAVAALEDQRQSFLNRLGLDPEALRAFDRSNDWQAAADRLVFPNSLN